MEWDGFLRRCLYVRRFEDNAYLPQLRLSSDAMHNLVKGNLVVFPNLRTLKLDVCNLRLPFLSPSVVDLTVLIARPLHGDDFVTICSALRRAPALLPNVTVLRIDGDDHLEFFYRPLARFCLALPKLSMVTLAPSALSEAMLQALSQIPTLIVIRVIECARSNGVGYSYEAGARLGGVRPILLSNSFPRLRDLAFTSSSPAAAVSVIAAPHFPCHNLESLWIRWPDISWHEPDAIRRLLLSLSERCLSLKSLTLRFATYTDVSFDSDVTILPLEFRHIEPFLDFPCLTHFAIDHSLPLLLTEDDIGSLSVRAFNFVELWLNPYPAVATTEALDGLPRVRCLAEFARHCQSLRRLGLLLDGRDPGLEIGGSVRFHALMELLCQSATAAP